MNTLVSWRPLAILFVATVCLTGSAAAAERAYSSRGTAQFVSPTEFVGRGTATHLGSYQEVGTAAFSATEVPNVLGVVANVTYTAANGDELRAVITGQLDTLTGVIVGIVSFSGGTGRFVNATGTGEFSGQMLGGGAVRAAINATFDF